MVYRSFRIPLTLDREMSFKRPGTTEIFTSQTQNLHLHLRLISQTSILPDPTSGYIPHKSNFGEWTEVRRGNKKKEKEKENKFTSIPEEDNGSGLMSPR